MKVKLASDFCLLPRKSKTSVPARTKTGQTRIVLLNAKAIHDMLIKIGD